MYAYRYRTLRDHTLERIRASLQKETILAKTFLEECPVHDESIAAMDKIADRIGASLGLRATIITMDGKVLGDSERTLEQVAEMENHKYRPEVQQALEHGTGMSKAAQHDDPDGYAVLCGNLRRGPARIHQALHASLGSGGRHERLAEPSARPRYSLHSGPPYS